MLIGERTACLWKCTKWSADIIKRILLASYRLLLTVILITISALISKLLFNYVVTFDSIDLKHLIVSNVKIYLRNELIVVKTLQVIVRAGHSKPILFDICGVTVKGYRSTKTTEYQKNQKIPYTSSVTLSKWFAGLELFAIRVRSVLIFSDEKIISVSYLAMDSNSCSNDAVFVLLYDASVSITNTKNIIRVQHFFATIYLQPNMVSIRLSGIVAINFRSEKQFLKFQCDSIKISPNDKKRNYDVKCSDLVVFCDDNGDDDDCCFTQPSLVFGVANNNICIKKNFNKKILNLPLLSITFNDNSLCVMVNTLIINLIFLKIELKVDEINLLVSSTKHSITCKNIEITITDIAVALINFIDVVISTSSVDLQLSITSLKPTHKPNQQNIITNLSTSVKTILSGGDNVIKITIAMLSDCVLRNNWDWNTSIAIFVRRTLIPEIQKLRELVGKSSNKKDCCWIVESVSVDAPHQICLNYCDLCMELSLEDSVLIPAHAIYNNTHANSVMLYPNIVVSYENRKLLSHSGLVSYLPGIDHRIIFSDGIELSNVTPSILRTLFSVSGHVSNLLNEEYELRSRTYSKGCIGPFNKSDQNTPDESICEIEFKPYPCCLVLNNEIIFEIGIPQITTITFTDSDIRLETVTDCTLSDVEIKSSTAVFVINNADISMYDELIRAQQHLIKSNPTTQKESSAKTILLFSKGLTLNCLQRSYESTHNLFVNCQSCSVVMHSTPHTDSDSIINIWNTIEVNLTSTTLNTSMAVIPEIKLIYKCPEVFGICENNTNPLQLIKTTTSITCNSCDVNLNRDSFGKFLEVIGDYTVYWPDNNKKIIAAGYIQGKETNFPYDNVAEVILCCSGECNINLITNSDVNPRACLVSSNSTLLLQYYDRMTTMCWDFPISKITHFACPKPHLSSEGKIILSYKQVYCEDSFKEIREEFPGNQFDSILLKQTPRCSFTRFLDVVLQNSNVEVVHYCLADLLKFQESSYLWRNYDQYSSDTSYYKSYASWYSNNRLKNISLNQCDINITLENCTFNLTAVGGYPVQCRPKQISAKYVCDITACENENSKTAHYSRYHLDLTDSFLGELSLEIDVLWESNLEKKMPSVVVTCTAETLTFPASLHSKPMLQKTLRDFIDTNRRDSSRTELPSVSNEHCEGDGIALEVDISNLIIDPVSLSNLKCSLRYGSRISADVSFDKLMVSDTVTINNSKKFKNKISLFKDDQSPYITTISGLGVIVNLKAIQEMSDRIKISRNTPMVVNDIERISLSESNIFSNSRMLIVEHQSECILDACGYAIILQSDNCIAVHPAGKLTIVNASITMSTCLPERVSIDENNCFINDNNHIVNNPDVVFNDNDEQHIGNYRLESTDISLCLSIDRVSNACVEFKQMSITEMGLAECLAVVDSKEIKTFVAFNPVSCEIKSIKIAPTELSLKINQIATVLKILSGVSAAVKVLRNVKPVEINRQVSSGRGSNFHRILSKIIIECITLCVSHSNKVPLLQTTTSIDRNKIQLSISRWYRGDYEHVVEPINLLFTQDGIRTRLATEDDVRIHVTVDKFFLRDLVLITNTLRQSELDKSLEGERESFTAPHGKILIDNLTEIPLHFTTKNNSEIVIPPNSNVISSLAISDISLTDSVGCWIGLSDGHPRSLLYHGHVLRITYESSNSNNALNKLLIRSRILIKNETNNKLIVSGNTVLPGLIINIGLKSSNNITLSEDDRDCCLVSIKSIVQDIDYTTSSNQVFSSTPKTYKSNHCSNNCFVVQCHTEARQDCLKKSLYDLMLSVKRPISLRNKLPMKIKVSTVVESCGVRQWNEVMIEGNSTQFLSSLPNQTTITSVEYLINSNSVLHTCSLNCTSSGKLTSTNPDSKSIFIDTTPDNGSYSVVIKSSFYISSEFLSNKLSLYVTSSHGLGYASNNEGVPLSYNNPILWNEDIVGKTTISLSIKKKDRSWTSFVDVSPGEGERCFCICVPVCGESVLPLLINVKSIYDDHVGLVKVLPCYSIKNDTDFDIQVLTMATQVAMLPPHSETSDVLVAANSDMTSLLDKCRLKIGNYTSCNFNPHSCSCSIFPIKLRDPTTNNICTVSCHVSPSQLNPSTVQILFSSGGIGQAFVTSPSILLTANTWTPVSVSGIGANDREFPREMLTPFRCYKHCHDAFGIDLSMRKLKINETVVKMADILQADLPTPIGNGLVVYCDKQSVAGQGCYSAAIQILVSEKQKTNDTDQPTTSPAEVSIVLSIGISYLSEKNNIRSEILYTQIDDINYLISRNATTGYIDIYLTCGRVQVNNSLRSAVLKTIVACGHTAAITSLSDKNEAASIKEFLKISILGLRIGSTVIKISEFTVALREMTISVDDMTVIELFQFFKPAILELLNQPISTTNINNNQLYIEASNIALHPIKLYITYLNTDLPMVAVPPEIRLLQAAHTITDLQVDLPLYCEFAVFTPVIALVQNIVLYYKSRSWKTLGLAILSLDVIGNPVGLLGNVGDGISDLFYEPAAAFKEDEIKMTNILNGIGKGAGSLVNGIAYGLTNATTGVAASLGKGIASLSMDDEYLVRRRQRNITTCPKGLGEGFVDGVGSLASGVSEGITGIVSKPIEGCKDSGIQGLLSGVGKGLVGAVVKPVTGIIDLATKTTEGARNMVVDPNSVGTRNRPTRVVTAFPPLQKYDTDIAVVAEAYFCFKRGKYQSDYLLAVLADSRQRDTWLFISNYRVGLFRFTSLPLLELSKVWSSRLSGVSAASSSVGTNSVVLNFSVVKKTFADKKKPPQRISFTSSTDMEMLLAVLSRNPSIGISFTK